MGDKRPGWWCSGESTQLCKCSCKGTCSLFFDQFLCSRGEKLNRLGMNSTKCGNNLLSRCLQNLFHSWWTNKFKLAAYITFKGSNRSPLATGVQQNGITLFSCTPSTTRAMYEGLRIIGKLIMDNLNETGKINKPFNMLRTDSISVQDQDINKNLLIQI